MLTKSKEIEKDIIKNRRIIHEFAEVGFEIPKTLAHIINELKSYGIEPQKMGKAGITFTLGNPNGKTILLRADMDALPMLETSGLDFAAVNGNCHACGHDVHTAILLGAAKILKNMENRLKGQVKFMFQPAEEILAGAQDMIDNGILENPKVDAAFAIHVMVGTKDSKSGHIYYKAGPIMASGDAMKVEIIGEEAHGSTPHLGIDAIQIASKIILEINGMIGTDMPSGEGNIALVGKINGGTAVNTVANKTILDISLRSQSVESRKKLIKRVEEISKGIAELHGGKAIVTHEYGMPPLINDVDLTNEFKDYATKLVGDEEIGEIERFSGSEDFSMIAERVPSSLFTLGVGSLDEGHKHYLHHSSVCFNESAFHVGSALYAQIAKRWLEENS